MNKLDADKIIEEYIQKLYGFSVNKLGDPDEAEELSARIVAEVYEVLVRRENIVNLNGYIYKIAHNIWTRYIGRKSKSRNYETSGGFDGTDGFENIPDESDFTEKFQKTEQYGLIRREIAYLSKMQREIVVRHYYRGEKVKTIAAAMALPESTVKWHLSCTRKELMIGMDKIRTVGKLGVQPIRFVSMGHNVHPGSKGDAVLDLPTSIEKSSGKIFTGLAALCGVSPKISRRVFRGTNPLHGEAGGLTFTGAAVRAGAKILPRITKNCTTL